MIRAPRATTLAVVLALAACSDGGTGPNEEPSPVGVYALVQANGETLPALIDEGPFFEHYCHTWAVSGSLTIHENDQRYTRVEGQAYDCIEDDGYSPDGNTIPEVTRTGAVLWIGQAFELSRDGGTLFTMSIRGSWNGEDQITVIVDLADDTPDTYVYRRQ